MNTIYQDNLQQAQQMLDTLAALEPAATAAADKLAAALLKGNKLLACGNGGSAADASHLTTEFVIRFNQDRRPYPAISLNTNGGDLTACGNDYSFDEVFARQVRAFGLPGDVLFAFTTSGNSENVLRALHAAKATGVFSVAFLGRTGGRCKGIADIDLIVPVNITARVQEGHKFLLHSICEIVEVHLHAAAAAGTQPPK